MKRITAILTILAVVSLTASAFADPVARFKSGLKTVVMSPLQVSSNIKTETSGHGFLPFALAGGLLKGSFYMAKDIATGTLHMVTAPLAMKYQ